MNNQAHKLFLEAKRLRDESRQDEGLKLIDEALQLEPSAGGYWLLKGQLHEDANDWDAAEATYRKSIEVSPASYKSWAALGLLLAERGRREDAIGCLKRAVEIWDDEMALTILADLLMEHDPSLSLTYTNRALIKNPHWDEAHALYEEARKHVQAGTVRPGRSLRG